MERVVLFRLAGGKPVGAFEQRQTAQTQLRFIETRNFKVRLAHARFASRSVVGHGLNNVAARRQVRLAVKKYLAASGRFGLIGGTTELVTLAQLLDYLPGLIPYQSKDGEIGVVILLFIIRSVGEGGSGRFDEYRRETQPLRFRKT